MSSVRLKSLQWDNCFSFGSGNSIELNSDSVTQIIGPNGFGKSSIPLIIEEGLYNKNSKGVKKADIPNRVLNEPYNINIGFDVDADDYLVVVKRTGATVKVFLYKNGEDISSHTATATYKEIQELLGMDFKVFQQLVYQSTNSSLQFLTATDTTRKKFLIDLFDLSSYTELFELFKEAIKDISAKTNKLDGRISTINNWLAENSEIDLNKKELKEIPERPDYSEKIGILSHEIQSISTKKSAIQKNEALKKQLSSIPIEDLKSQFESLEVLDESEKQNQLGSLVSGKSSSTTLINKLKSLDDQCPTCLQTIDKNFYNELLSEANNNLENYATQIKAIEKEITEIRSNNSLWKSLSEEIKQYEALENKIDFSLESNILGSTKQLEEELADIKNSMKTIENEISKAQKLNTEIEKHNARIDLYNEQNDKLNIELQSILEELNVLKQKLSSLEVLKLAFSTNGLIAYKLENLVKDLEVYTNEFLAELSDGRFTIEFSISNDKLNVILTDEGQEISISSPSSGEMARINISTLLAIRKIMSSISKNTINVLFLDEVVSTLDINGKERLVEVLLKQHELNTFIVSHGWEHPLLYKLTINKENGISYMEN